MDETSIMNTITWVPSTNQKLDNLFDTLREQQYNDRSHRLWSNYSTEFLNHCVALTICFEHELPIVCSSISYRDCWPKNFYRILNRTWKPNQKIKFPRRLSQSIAETAKSQLAWLEENTDSHIQFISRQTDNWDQWLADNLNYYGLDFKTDKYYYLTCPNQSDTTCWQKIIYQGSKNLLKKWPRQL